jgi:hypothetical protein
MTENAIVLMNGGDFLLPAAPLNTMLATYQAKKDFISQVLAEGVDFGKIPGAGDKPALFKAGAEKMTSFFGLAPVFEDVQTVEDWTGNDHNGEPFFFYRQRCKLYRGTRMIGSADGSCNSWEKKYRYRSSGRLCPSCGKATIINGKAEYGGGYICFAKKGGCGAKFKTGDKSIEDQVIGEVKNTDIADQVNTILKMSQKRALVAAVLIATNISDYFTQDIEDYTDRQIIDGAVSEVKHSEATDVPFFPPHPAVAKPADAPAKHPEAPGQTPAPQAAQSAIVTDAMPYEETAGITTSDGKPYRDIDNNTLVNMANSITKKLMKAGYTTPEDKAQAEYKLRAIRAILAHDGMTQ